MASAAAENERNRQLQQISFLQSYKALTDSGVPQQEAIAAVSNPSLMRTLAARYLGARAQGNATGRTVDFAASSLPQQPPVASQDIAGGQPPSAPSLAGVHRAPDGNFYASDPSRPGKYVMVR